ncbi:MAG: hypothetical protein N2645_06885 [Clostridia bacterium]|nr:hypothetical protein [Clostridia bacterium]
MLKRFLTKKNVAIMTASLVVVGMVGSSFAEIVLPTPASFIDSDVKSIVNNFGESAKLSAKDMVALAIPLMIALFGIVWGTFKTVGIIKGILVKAFRSKTA